MNNKYRSLLESSTGWLCLVIAVGAGVRLYGLDFQSLWLDEGLQYFVATHNSLEELFFQTRSFHPPLSFMINHIFLLIGESDFLLRLPSALFGIASLPVLYILARDLTSPRDAVFVVLVLALSPFHIWYSQEGRMYSQLLFLSLLSSVFLMQALKSGKVGWWIAYILVGAAGMYTHVFMVLALGAQFLWVLLYHRRYLVSITASGVVVALLFLPWAVLLPWISDFAADVSTGGLTGGATRAGKAGFTWAAMPYTFFAYSAGFSLGPTVAELHENKSLQFILSFLPSILLVATVFGLLLTMGIVVMYKRSGPRPWVFALLGLCVPLLGAIAYSSARPWTTFNVRYTVIAFPYFCLFIGIALSFLLRAHRVVGSVAVLAVVGISSASIYNHFADPRYAKEDVRSAVAFWRQTRGNEPLLAFGVPYPGLRYVGTEELNRFIIIGHREDVVPVIEQILDQRGLSSAYVLLARDWNQQQEKALRKAFGKVPEKTYPGVKMFRIYRPQALDMSGSPQGFRNVPCKSVDCSPRLAH